MKFVLLEVSICCFPLLYVVAHLFMLRIGIMVASVALVSVKVPR